MPAPEVLQLVIESSYGTMKASPVAGTDSFYIRLSEANSFSMRPKPKQFQVPYGGGDATPALLGSAETEVMGNLKTLLYPAQASILMGWCAGKINTGQTSPWTTTEIAGDLPSVSLYHAIQRSDGTYKRKRYAGCKVSSWKLTASRDSQVVSLDIGIRAQKVVGNAADASADPDATAFPFPAETAYPSNPFLFQHSSGNLKIANSGTARVGYESVGIDVTNKLDGRAYESRFLQLCRFKGRDSKLTAKLLLRATPDDRAAYEAITTQATSLKFDNGTNSLLIDFKGTNFFTGNDDDLPLDKMYEQGLTLQNLFEQATGADITYTYA